jgi:formylglycine-generating enzyme required for sulfatase activity
MPILPKIFIAYAREDAPLLEKLRKPLNVLRRNGHCDIFFDGEIVPGERWNERLKAELHQADIYLLLVTDDFLDSDYINDVELPKALEKEKAGKAKVVPIILRHCMWQYTLLKEFQVVLHDGKPIDMSDGYAYAVEQVARVIEERKESLRLEQVAEEHRLEEARRYDRKKQTFLIKPSNESMLERNAESIRNLIANGQLREAIERLLPEQNAVALSGEFTRGQEAYECNTITYEEWSRIQSKISKSVLSLIEMLKEPTQKLQNESNRFAQQPTKTGGEKSKPISKKTIFSFVLGLTLLSLMTTITIVISSTKENAPLQHSLGTKSITIDDQPDVVKDLFGIEMIPIQGGPFVMGDTSKINLDWQKYSYPLCVFVKDFLLSKYEVTLDLWIKVMKKYPSVRYTNNDSIGNNLPIVDISWDEIQLFIKKLNKVTGMKYRLPSEAEWEFAARGGNKSKGYKYAGSNELDSVGWNKDNASDRKHPVGLKKANELGLYDMSGNVWEWCEDIWHDDIEDVPKNGNPWTTNGDKKIRVRRGGSWDDVSEQSLVISRLAHAASEFSYSMGFRLAR